MKTNATMSKTVLTRGVVVITLTAKVYKGKVVTTYHSRIGFCGEFNKLILTEIKKKFKEVYEEQYKSEYKNADKIICSATAKTTECDMILNGGE